MLADRLAEGWGSAQIVTRGLAYDASRSEALACFEAGELEFEMRLEPEA